MKHSQNDLKRGTMLFFVHSGRNTTAIVLDSYGIAFKNLHIDGIAESCHGLIDTVIHHLIYEVMKSPFRDISNIHGRTLAHRLKTFEDLYTIGGILLLRQLHIFFFNHLGLLYIKILQIY